MRILLFNSKLFFDEILEDKNINLKQLSSMLNFNYSNIKQYRRGEKTLPSDLFYRLIESSPKREYWIKNKKELSDNWGNVLGGSIAAKMSNSSQRAKYARKFRRIKKVEINLNENFCEFYGALLGDGCISKYKDYDGVERIVIRFSGNKRLDSNYFKYLKNKISEEFGIYIYYYEYKEENVCILSIGNKGLCTDLNRNFGVPIGLKYKKLHISKKILNLPWGIKKFVLRGLFDTDGCILANKREDYRYPWITITSKSQSFRNQIIDLLKEQGYPAYNTGKDVCVRGIANVKRWFGDIGSSNSRNIIKYKHFLKHGYLPARLLQ